MVAHRRALGVNAFRIVAAIVACAAACSTYGSADDDATPVPDRDAGADASSPASDAAALVDAGGDVTSGDGGAVSCDRSLPFGAPITVPGLTSDNNEGSARLTPDELQVFWSRYDGDWAIWTASRTAKGDPFGLALKLAIVNDPTAADLDPSPTNDSRSLYFTSERDGGVDIYRSERASKSVPFGDPVRFDEASGSANDRRPFVAVDGASLWFDSARSGRSRIYRLGLSAIGIGTPELIDLGAASDMDDEHPVISQDGLAIYFGGRGRADANTHVYMATRINAAAKFGTPARVVAWPGYAAPSWITADDCRLYVSIGGVGDGTRIYMVERAK
jgi:hypothetical protein